MNISETQIGIFLLLAAVAAIAVATEKSGKSMKRSEYFGVFIAVIIANMVLNAVARMNFGLGAALLGLAANFAIYFLFTRVSVQRARDASIPKGYCYLFVFPVTAFLMMLVLLVKPPATGAAPAAAD